jgi:hypothetical protein
LNLFSLKALANIAVMMKHMHDFKFFQVPVSRKIFMLAGKCNQEEK